MGVWRGFSQSAGTIHAQIRNCEIECWQIALRIQLPVNAEGAITTDLKVTSCTLAKASDSTDGGPIVKIDAQLTFGHNTNSQLNDITLLDCTVFNMAPNPPPGQHGLAISGGQNIKIIGGTYSNNSGSGGAGIAITGACGDVQIVGANLQPSPGAPNSNSQQYGLLISGSRTGAVLVSGCDMSGYTAPGSAAVSVTGTPSELRIVNCAGYNDMNSPLVASPPELVSGVSAATLMSPYFGASVFVYSNSIPVTLHIFGQTITSTFGIIFVPSAYDSFHFSAAPTTFSWIGK